MVATGAEICDKALTMGQNRVAIPAFLLSCIDYQGKSYNFSANHLLMSRKCCIFVLI